MSIEIKPRVVLYVFLSVFGLLFFAHLTIIVLEFALGYNYVLGLSALFHFDEETNVPSLFSGFCLAFSSLMLAVVAIAQRKAQQSFLPWLFLAIIFLFLSADEIIGIHERSIGPVRDALDATGVFYFAWIIPYGIATLVLALAYFRFLAALPRTVMILFIVSGGMYVGGAIGLEMISARHAEFHGMGTLPYNIMATIEESLEMLGVITFIYALFSYLSIQFPGFLVCVTDDKSRSESKTT